MHLVFKGERTAGLGQQVRCEDLLGTQMLRKDMAEISSSGLQVECAGLGPGAPVAWSCWLSCTGEG